MSGCQRQQGQVAGTFDRLCNLPLMFGTVARDAAWNYLSTLCDEEP